MEGKVLSLNISDKKGKIKTPIQSCLFIENVGMENDSHAEGGIRSVSLLAYESFENMIDNGVKNLTYGVFAENITTKGIILHKLLIGTKLKIGEVILEISKIGKECHAGNGCVIMKQTGKCVMPVEGIFAIVLKGGILKIGEKIEVLD